MKTGACLATWALGLVACSGAWAAPDLVITEIYVGVDGDDVTADWFEVSNLGDMTWDLGVDPLWFDDSGPSAANAVPINDITSIAPNESVIVMIGNASTVAPFFAAWDDSGQLAGVQIGFADGSALGQGGDQVTLIDSIAPFSILALQAYTDIGPQGSTLIYNPVTQTFTGNAVAGVWGAYAAPGGPAGDFDEFPLIGSPGVVVPEPASLALCCIGALLVLRRKR